MGGLNNNTKSQYISLTEASEYSGNYSQEYLSLRARQGKLKAIKVGRNWVTTKEWIDSYSKEVNNYFKQQNVSVKPKLVRPTKGVVEKRKLARKPIFNLNVFKPLSMAKVIPALAVLVLLVTAVSVYPSYQPVFKQARSFVSDTVHAVEYSVSENINVNSKTIRASLDKGLLDIKEKVSYVHQSTFNKVEHLGDRLETSALDFKNTLSKKDNYLANELFLAKDSIFHFLTNLSTRIIDTSSNLKEVILAETNFIKQSFKVVFDKAININLNLENSVKVLPSILLNGASGIFQNSKENLSLFYKVVIREIVDLQTVMQVSLSKTPNVFKKVLRGALISGQSVRNQLTQLWQRVNSNAISVSNKAKVSLVQGIGVWEDILYYLNSDRQHLQAFTSSFGSGLNQSLIPLFRGLKKLQIIPETIKQNTERFILFIIYSLEG